MLSFLKKKATIDELAIGLLALALGPEKQPTRGADSLKDELLYLRIFAVRYGACQVARDGVARRLMDAYDKHLSEAVKQAPAGSDLVEVIGQRFHIYTNALNTPHQNGPVWNVGKAFARFCGDELDFWLVCYGVIRFGEIVKAASDVLKSARIVYA